MIEIAGLTLTRGTLRVLDDVTLTLPAGGVTAIIGPNGAGKSTLLNCLAGLITPDAGTVRIDDADIHRLREPERALRLSLLPQGQSVVPRLTVRELVSFGRWPHHRGRPGPEDRALVEAALARFALIPLAERLVEELSGGQRQRVLVAMAFAQATPWMLLDEPLAALDPRHARDIMERLHEVAASGRSVLLVVHDLAIAARYAQSCICMKNGRILAAGPWDQTVTGDLLSTLYDTPLRLADVEGQRVILAG
ncbi:ATP-binding cassette domain-containing protein [Pararhodobacter zhoushanensis]|uniref:ATP-binding cassette domain-containing protein n=1 Tax=Pararhodobacter zhoushanensis TaxID=2479545 RepID=A0ABT3H5M6_9RHOB|nr:ATP-binding cassette domain-containing protein [Pararhodobacter zhoushanensis]MCW1935050.1 ATP-binding cassette domain-containing protein [Pararhodobacter zhoushanensis]